MGASSEPRMWSLGLIGIVNVWRTDGFVITDAAILSRSATVAVS
jgi:hypothetical protein